MSNLRQKFSTDVAKETAGIKLAFGPVVFTCRRMGGANKRFTKLVEERTRPYRGAINRGHVDEETLRPIILKTFCETCLVNVEGLTDDKNEVIKFQPATGTGSMAGWETVFDELNNAEMHDTSAALISECNKAANYAKEDSEADGKN